MDDILVIGNTQEDHDAKLKKVLDQIMCAGMMLNKSKCRFRVNSVKLLGHVIDEKESMQAPVYKEC